MQVGARFIDFDRTAKTRKPVECVVTAVPSTSVTSTEKRLWSNQVYWARGRGGRGGEEEERPYIWDKEKGRLVRAGKRVLYRAKYPSRPVASKRLVERDFVKRQLKQHLKLASSSLDLVRDRFEAQFENDGQYTQGAIAAYEYARSHYPPSSHRPTPQLVPRAAAAAIVVVHHDHHAS